MRRKEQHLLVEQVGARLRALMPFLNPVKIEVEETAAVRQNVSYRQLTTLSSICASEHDSSCRNRRIDCPRLSR